VEFINESGECEYRTSMRSNMWTKLNKKYFHEWRCRVFENDSLVFDETCNPTGKRVYVSLESKSLGDTLAWFPYVEEFRKKWNCQMICSTFMNDLFVENYPEIEFVNPGTPVNNIYGMYLIGWFYDDDNFSKNRNPNDFKEIPLGKTAADILGLDFEYVRAKITNKNIEKKKRVGIAIHSTAQTKYWNNPTGWQEVTDYLNDMGYEVLILSKEGDGYMGNFQPNGAKKLEEGSLENLIDVMLSCEFFMGIGSGLSWLSWSLNIPTVLISGFSTPISEFEGDNVIRIFNNNVCNGCFNRHKFDPGDWNWCPDYKGTERQFECTKSITGKMVINTLKTKGWIKQLELSI
jgi:autotransporter strand-loop-strand O-heptosyltransferase